MDLPTTSTMIAALISLVTLTMMNHPTYCMAAPQQPLPSPLPLPFKDHHHHHHPRDLLLVSDSASATNSTENKRDHRSPSVSEGGREWSDWSEWGPCSRTCDGGATYQTRQCLDTVRGCPNGRGIRYQICNMQPCPELVDFRLQQCQSYNTIPYQGKLHSWVPHHVAEAKSPCALTCRAVNSSGPLVVQLAARVHDGTRCKPGSLDMCVDGTCQAVGCDLQLNSNLKIDACGVCGGDGSTCLTNGNGNSDGNGPQPRYQWEFSHQLSPCSASCDGGEQEVAVVCRDTSTGAQVEAAELCDPNERPPPKLVKCNQDPCPPKWIVEPWGACSASCGGGVKERHVHCQQGRNHSKVDDVICSALIGHKARTHEPCNTHDCPGWFEGPWSLCSKTCGDDGFQTRPVVCRDARGHVTNACRDQDRPASSRSCPTLDPCPTTAAPELTTTAPNRPARQKVTPFSLFDDDDEEEAGDGEEDGDGEDDKNEADLKGVLVKPSGSSAPAALLSEKLQVGEISLVPTDPTFIAGDWSPCSVTCGDGTREREVHCKIFLEFSKTIAKLPDKECPGPKPSETEPCFMRPCSLSNKYEPWIGSGSSSNDQSSYKLLAATRKPAEDLRAATKLELNAAAPTATKSAVVAAPSTSLYAWKMSGFSQCSASCLGGVQESIIECIREQDGQRVSPQLCPMERRPDSITRTCNDIPCPPRWNASDFSSCSRSCGGGVQTRDVHCIHEVARGGGNTLPVNSDLCPQPPPRAQQFCNMIDCPVEWKTGEWSQCSSTCEGGFRVRKVTCQQLLALGQLITKTANQCNPTTRPTESKPCNSDRVCTSTTTTETGDDRGNSQTAETSFQQTTVDLFLLSTTTASNQTPVPAIGTTTTVNGSSSTSSSTGSRVVHHLAPKILSTNQTFVQQSVTKKKVTLKIGGRATVYKGTQVKIRCPVKHYDKAKILWMKDHTQLTKSPKHELNKKGMLRIRDVMYSDSGVYSCVAGRSVANITLTVRPIAVAPPSNSIGSATPINPDNRQQPPVDDFEDDLQSLTTGMKGNSLTNPHHHPASESGLSDQEQLEWPLLQEEEEQQQQQKNRRINDQQKTSSRRAKLRNGLVVTTATTRRKTGRPKSNHKASDSNKIRKEEQLKFEWLVTPWSKCSQTCGGSGFQVRAAQCIVRLNDNVTRSVDSSLCSAEDAGLLTSDGRPPTTVQKCGLESCPKWKTGAWSPCEKSRCFTWNTALQRRPMDCVMDDGTVLDPILCDDRSKPSSKRECFNEHCRGEWKASEWSHCTATCDSVGFQSRLIHCVWNGTDSPAGLACADLPRLDVTRPCRGPPCPERGECLNQSEYCALVQTLELCYIPRYREHCCLTCSRHQPTITTTINNKNNQKKKKKKKTQTMKTKSSSTTHHHRHHHHRKMTTASAPATLSTTALPLKQ